MAKKPEIYVSVDIEADGPIPGPHSMLSIGAVAYNEAGDEVAHYSANLETLEDADSTSSHGGLVAALPRSLGRLPGKHPTAARGDA